MFVLDLFNSRHEKELHDGAVDNLEARRIEDLIDRMDYMMKAYKQADSDEVRAAIKKRYEEFKAERDSYYKIKDECMGYGNVVGEAGPRPEDVPAYLRKQQGQAPLTPGQVKAPRPDTLSDPRNLNKNIGNRNEIEEQGTRSTVAQDNFNEIVAAWQDEKDYVILPFADGRQATLTRPQLWNTIVTLSQVNPNKRTAYTEQKFKDFDTFMRWASQLKRYKVPPKKKKNAQPGLNLQPPVPTTQATQAVDQPQANSVPQSVSEAGGQKKNPEESDLTGNTARDPVVARELRKMRGRQPAAKSDIEALVRDEMDQSARTEQELAQQQDELTRQQQQLTQVHQANQEQGAEIQSQKQQITALNRRVQQAMTAPAPTKQKTATPTTAPATGSQTAYTPEPAAAPAEQPVDNKSAEDIARLEKQIQQLELMMTLRTPAQQDDLRDRIEALEKERDAKIEKQKAATAKAAATKKANKGKAAVAVASEKPSTAPTTVEPEKTQKSYYPDTAGIAGMGGSTKAEPNKPTGMDFLDNLLKGHKIEVDQGETAKVDPEELRQTAEVDESADNPLDAGAGRQLSRTPEIRRLRQQKDYELMLKKELANRIQDRDESDDEQDFQDISESNIKRLLSNLKDMTDAEFLERYKKPKQYWRNQLTAKPTTGNIADIDSDIDTARVKPTFDRAGRMVKARGTPVQQGMKRMLGRPKATRPAAELNPVEVTMQVPNRKTDQYDLLPARIFNNEAEAREFARRVNGHITSIRPVMHETDTKTISVKQYTGDELDLLVAHLAQQMGLSPAQIRQRYVEPMLKKGQIKIVPDKSVHEGFQDFNRVEPYAVCLAGKPVKQFDYYEDARRFHDNWKKKLYNQGDKAKADKITLMPLNLDEAAKKGLYYYVNKRKAAGTSRSKNNPKAPTAQAWKDAAKTAKKEDVAEAGSPAQQAAIAIAKKKEQGMAEGDDLTHAGQDVMVWTGPPTNNPPRDDKKYWIRGKLDSTEMHGGSMRANVMTAKGMYNPELNRVFKAEQGVAEDTDSWFRVTVKTPNGKNHNIQVPANSHGTAKRKALAYCAKNSIAGAEFVSAMRMPTLDEQGVAEASYINGHVEDPESLRWKQTSMSYEQAVAKFGKNNVKQDGKNRLGQKIVMVLVPLGEQAETDYSKRRQREKDVDAGKPVAKQRQTGMTDYQKRRAQQKREMELGESTNYWTKLQNERNNRLNTLVNELNESIKDIK
jgi:hypothetical protein